MEFFYSKEKKMSNPGSLMVVLILQKIALYVIVRVAKKIVL